MAEESKKKSQLTNEETEQCIETLIERIKVLKESEHMKWDEFKKEVCVSQTTISNWSSKGKDGKPKEQNASMPKLESIMRIAYYFDVSLDWLLGLSKIKEISPVPTTYKEWIITIENYFNHGVVDFFYRPELDDTPDCVKDEQKEDEAFIKKKMSGSIGFQTSGLLPETKIPLEDNFYPVYTYTPHQDNIYDVSEDMHGVYPDILEIKDTFLRCIIACLHYQKNHTSKEHYELFRESIINQYANKRVLNLDVYELRVSDNLKNTPQYKKLLKGYNTISESLFAKYKSISEIDTIELERILKELDFWNNELKNKRIKTVSQLQDEYFEKKESNRWR
ncbi:MAG: hypothetical protein HFI75_15390 [Lachnospiraceae bacterium]|nr:hypothetical protein [Lachnospiraceae bacterium]